MKRKIKLTTHNLMIANLAVILILSLVIIDIYNDSRQINSITGYSISQNIEKKESSNYFVASLRFVILTTITLIIFFLILLKLSKEGIIDLYAPNDIREIKNALKSY